MLSKSLKEVVQRCQQGEKIGTSVYQTEKVPGKNEFLLFIKPSVTAQDAAIRLEDIIALVEERIHAFGLQVHDISVFSGPYLAAHKIMEGHYGVINRFAQNPDAIPEEAKERFEVAFGLPFDKAKVFGGITFMKHYPAVSAKALDYLWENVPSHRLGGGCYCASFSIRDERCFVINGFFPSQLLKYNKVGASIIAYRISGDLNWRRARHDFVGTTNPEVAKEGSIRKLLLENKEKLGLKSVTQAGNGIHLSAGPVEGLVELLRFYRGGSHKDLGNFVFGRLLLEHFTADKIDGFLANEEVEADEKVQSIFDFTEEKDSQEVITLLKKTSIIDSEETD